VALTLVLSPFTSVVRVVGEVPSNTVKPGDTLMLWRSPPARGDVIVGEASWRGWDEPTISTVLAVPGDRVLISDRLYINGRPVAVSLPPLGNPDQGSPRPYSEAESCSKTLGANEYWILPNFNAAPAC